jgi:hypothetical protein
VLSRRRDLADLLGGGGRRLRAAAEVLNARYVWQLFGAGAGARRGSADPSADTSY